MLSIQDLIKNRVKSEDRFITVNIEKMGGDLKFKIPDMSTMFEYKEMFGTDLNKIADKLIYEHSVDPALNDETLLQTLGCKENPSEVVEKLFGNDIKFEILNLITDEIEQNTFVKKVDEIKN